MFMLAKRLGILPSLEAAYGKSSLALRTVKRMALSFDDIDWRRTKVYSFDATDFRRLNTVWEEPR